MKRAFFVGTGTLVGLAATMSYAPTAQSIETTEGLGGLGGLPAPAATAPTEVVSPVVSDTAAPIPTYDPSATVTPVPVDTKPGNGPKPKATKDPKPKASATPSGSPTTAPIETVAPGNGDFVGTVVRAGVYGTVQVQIRVQNGVITDIGTLAYPNKEAESQQISATAIPQLRAAALAAQSANIASISGASYTASAYKASLAAAIKAAGL